MDKQEAERLVASVPHWHHRFEIFPGVETPGSYPPAFLFAALKLPPSLHGKRVLDIGPSDGYFSRELFLRGADVTCIDYRAKSSHGFAMMERILGHEFKYHHMNVYGIDESLGQFDIVLFLGVLYHLPDMIGALLRIRSICKDRLFIESEIDPSDGPPIARYYPAATLNADLTNFWTPNRACVRAMLSDTAFTVREESEWGHRALFDCEVVADTSCLYKTTLGYGAARL